MDSTAIPALVMAAHDTSSRVRYFAMQSLMWLQPPGLRALLAELPRADSATASDIVLAISGLNYAGDTTTNAILMVSASDTNTQVRLAAISGADLSHAVNVDAWINVFGRFVDSPHKPLRLEALERLGEAGPIAEPEVPRMLRALGDVDPQVRNAALRALSGLGASGGRAVTGMVQMMRSDPDTSLRVEAAGRLGDLYDAGAPAVPALLTALGDPLISVRRAAIGSLGDIGLGALDSARAIAVIDSLALRTVARDSGLRRAAARSLARLDDRATPRLARLANSPDSAVALIAIEALAPRTTNPIAADALFNALGDARAPIRRSAADAVGAMGNAALPRLKKLSSNGTSAQREAAARAERYIRSATRLPVANRCYRLFRSAWGSPLDRSGDSIFTTSPEIIRFGLVKNPRWSASGRPYMQVTAANGNRETVDGPGVWRPYVKADSLEIVWSNGFSGVSMSLAVKGDSLSGAAKTFWDFPRPSDSSPVTGIRVSCDTPM